MAKKKAGDVFVDFTAAYDTVRYRRLTCKLLCLLPDRRMISMVMELVCNRSFTLTIGSGKQSRLRRLKDDIPLGSVLASLLFNICIHDQPQPPPESLHMLTIWQSCTLQATGRR